MRPFCFMAMLAVVMTFSVEMASTAQTDVPVRTFSIAWQERQTARW